MGGAQPLASRWRGPRSVRRGRPRERIERRLQTGYLDERADLDDALAR
jgi:urocanate hydratase